MNLPRFCLEWFISPRKQFPTENVRSACILVYGDHIKLYLIVRTSYKLLDNSNLRSHNGGIA
jgi:hypothetical protein